MTLDSAKFYDRHEEIGTSMVTGGQWGDEGKGKVTDKLAQKSDVIVRFNGGHNAGHSVTIGSVKYALHMLPSGILTTQKENIILSSCVLGSDLHKIDSKKFINPGIENEKNYGLSKFIYYKGQIFFNGKLEDLYLRDKETNKEVKVGFINELEDIESSGLEIGKEALKISSQVPVIGMHDVLLDALDEQYRILAGNRPIGTTGSGISRAYSAKSLRKTNTLYDLIHNNGEAYFTAIKEIWGPYQYNFPRITADDLINHAKNQRKKILELIKKQKIVLINDEKGYIQDLRENGKKIVFEGAQSVMISDENSFYGTASTPNLKTVLDVTGLRAQDIGNIFLTLKYPNSSVGIRPQFMTLEQSDELNKFRDKYEEYGVTSGKPRDLWHLSLPHTARGVEIATAGIDDMEKLVPVINRIDAFENTKGLYRNGIIKIIQGFSYEYLDGISGKKELVQVGINGNKKITPENLLKNFPGKSQELNLFNGVKDIDYIELTGKTTKEQVNNLLGYYVASMFPDDNQKEIIIGTSPDRNGLELRQIKAKRS